MTRRTRTAALLALLAPLAPMALGGCEWLRGSTRADTVAPADGPVEARTGADLVAYLNRQSEAVQSVKYPRVLIDAQVGSDNFTLNDSTLVCQKPRNFSLVGGKAVMGDIVVAGSNSQEFWVYNKFSDPKYIVCSHADFERGVAQLPFPFDADWALQALGMSPYDPNRVYKLDTDQAAREHRLSYEATTPQGATVTRTVVFAADAAQGNRPQVLRHLIADADGKPLATADITQVVRLSAGRKADGSETVVEVPTEVVLEWPTQKFRMKLELRSPELNKPIPPADSRELFTRPQIRGVTPVNLTTLQAAPSGRQFRGATPDLPPRRTRR
jgi:hypothetical protein